MKRLQIFRAGKFVAADGNTYQFTEADLKGMVAAYDPAKHEAPLVVGHPAADAPAYGWVKGLAFEEAALCADPDQVDPAFAEMVKGGRFKKRSASFYAPDDPRNPVPGSWYLRHVGFLGAQPPAVKGLKAVNFAAGEGITVEFGEWADRTVARLLRKMKNFWIEKFGKEEADKLIDEWDLEAIQEEALRPTAVPQFTEPKRKEESMTPEEIKKKEAELTAREASFAERETKLADLEKENGQLKADAAARERQGREEKFVAFCDTLPTRISPVMRPAVIAHMHALHGQPAVEFAEADGKKVQKSPLEIYQTQLQALPEVVSFAEHATRKRAGEGSVDGADSQAIARAAVEFQDAEAKAGRIISVTEAVAHVTKK